MKNVMTNTFTIISNSFKDGDVMKNMKKIVMILLSSFLITSYAYAGACPVLMKDVDAKLATAIELSEKQVAEIEKLRQDGEEAHNMGKHKESVKLLQEALAKLDI